MTSLADAYNRRVGEDVGSRRLLLGVGLFGAGALLAVCAIVIASTDLAVETVGLTTARQYAGILAGVGVPAVFLGIFTVLPASRQTRAAAVVGAGVALLGVALFVHAFPCQWSGSNCRAGRPDLTLLTTGIYFAGTLTTFWSLFVGIANFKSRNDPGGTVTLEVVREGETRMIEVPRSAVGDWIGAKGDVDSAGGVALLGETPAGDVDTQTNRPAGSTTTPAADPSTGPTAADASGGEVISDTGHQRDTGQGPTASSPRPGSGTARASSDGGASTEEITSLRDGAEITRRADESTDTGPRTAGDQYCGSCAHFRYVRTEEGMRPYCGFHRELMDDMEACEEWTPQ